MIFSDQTVNVTCFECSENQSNVTVYYERQKKNLSKLAMHNNAACLQLLAFSHTFGDRAVSNNKIDLPSHTDTFYHYIRSPECITFSNKLLLWHPIRVGNNKKNVKKGRL